MRRQSFEAVLLLAPAVVFLLLWFIVPLGRFLTLAFTGDAIHHSARPWTLFDLEWAYGQQIGLPSLAHTLRTLADLDLDLALPSHGEPMPRPDLLRAPGVFARLHEAIREGLVRSCHDLSEGGLAVAAAEMAFAGGVGADLTGAAVEGLPDAVALFLPDLLPELRATLPEIEAAGARWVDVEALGATPV